MSLSVDKILRQAQSCLKAGDLAEAEVLYKKVLSKFPKNKKATQGYQKLKAGIASKVSLSAVPSQDCIDELTSLYNLGRFEEVLSKARPLAQLFPKSAEIHIFLGEACGKLNLNEAAIKNYRNVLKVKPQYAEVYNNMGNAQNEMGDLASAIMSFQKAIDIKPKYAVAYNNMGNAQKEKGELKAAIESFTQALKIEPDYAVAYYNMGLALKDNSDLNAAIDCYKQAIKIKPDYAEAYYNMGSSLADKDEIEVAVKNYKQAIKIKPDYAEAYYNMGILLQDKGDLDTALESYKQAVEIKPDYAEAYNNMGTTQKEKGDLDAALESYKQALRIKVDYAETCNNMGTALQDKGYLDAAIESYKQAIKIKPDYAEAYSNLGLALNEKRDWVAAIKNYEQAIKLEPEYAEAHFKKSLTLLMLEKFEIGWPAYEWRWDISKNAGIALSSSKPIWQPGKHQKVLLWAEQGIGDEVMFASLISDLYPLCSKLIVQIDNRLISLFRRSFPNDIDFHPRTDVVSETKYDAHISMGSVPQHLRQNLESFKSVSQGWLSACEVKTLSLREKLLADGSETLIGISWHSTKPRSGAQNKLISLTKLANALDLPKVKLVNLQYGDVDNELESLREKTGIDVFQLSEIDNKDDIDGLAALIMACDKVISISNLTIHLAGALGKEAQVLLASSCDWRWGKRRSSSYWYDSVCLYRQVEYDGWDNVLQQL